MTNGWMHGDMARTQKALMNGVLIVDKPKSLTSHDVVNRVRRIVQHRSVGHLGTLDPLATGVLPLVIGNLTRIAQFYVGCDKTYEGVARFGFATNTYDADGKLIGEIRTASLSLVELKTLAEQFVGVIEQVPPPFSAKKINGVRAYELARKDRTVVLDPVKIEVKELEILSLSDDRATFRAHVSSGTYVRCIVHELGQRLGCGAHLEALRRTTVGEFQIEDAHTLEKMSEAAGSGEVEELFIHPRKLLPQFPAVMADDEMIARMRSGLTVNLPEFSQAPRVKVFEGQKEMVAIATRIAGTLFHADIVFAASKTSRSVDQASHS
ncbi:MAG: tRNA pseudouridine(55) synthase TruB [Acidobacteriota bacterium]|nr:tRNA pseudouridine(55) synthase TruB [Acidobacteriota bacterium]